MSLTTSASIAYQEYTCPPFQISFIETGNLKCAESLYIFVTLIKQDEIILYLWKHVYIRIKLSGKAQLRLLNNVMNKV